MELPIAIHKDEGSVYGVVVPDLPGCFSWGESIEEAINNTREAIYAHVETTLSEGFKVAISASKIEDLAALDDFNDVVWALVSIDFSRLDSKPERINVSIPRFLLSRIDAYASSRRETRSGFLTRAALRLMDAESTMSG